MKNRLKRGIAILLAASMLTTTGCSKDDLFEKIGKQGVSDSVQDTQNVTEVTPEDSPSDPSTNRLNAVYNGEKIEVNRNEVLEIDIGFDPYDVENGMQIDDMFEIYADSNLSYKVESVPPFYTFATGKIEFDPYSFGLGLLNPSIIGDYEETKAQVDSLPSSIRKGGEEHSWGILPRYYMVSYVDRNTGEKLSTPEITVIEINKEIQQTPRITFSQTENGNCRIYWKPVEGAQNYVVYALTFQLQYNFCYADVIGITDQTEWICESDVWGTDELDDEVCSMNVFFSGDVGKGEDDDYVYIGVIAVNENGASAISNMAEIDDIRAALPSNIAYDEESEET